MDKNEGLTLSETDALIIAKAIARLAQSIETASENIEYGMIHFKSR